MSTSLKRMVAVNDSFRDVLAAEFLNQFQTLSPMTATEFGTLLRLVRDEELHNFICHLINRKGWIYCTRKGKRRRITEQSTFKSTDTIHYNGPKTRFNKRTVYRIIVSE